MVFSGENMITTGEQLIINDVFQKKDIFKIDGISVSGYGLDKPEGENKLASVESTIEEAILDIVSFKLGNDNYKKLTASDITFVDGVFNKSSHKYYVRSIEVNVPINDTGCTFKQKINIGKTFTVENVTKK